MDIRQLRYFLTIAKEGQITRAAKKLNMAQPPLSQQLKLMEEELGFPLIERNGRSIELTKAGEILYKRAENILHQLEDAIVEIKETGEGLRGELSLGTVRSSAISFLPQKILDFRKHYPQVSYKIWEGDPYRIGQHLQNRDIELAIVRFPLDLDMDVNKVSLLVEPFVLVVPKNWEIDPSKTSIKMEELKDIPLMLIHRNNGGGAYESVISECQRFGFKPNIILECPDSAILLSLVDSGVGASILQKSTTLTFPTDKIRIIDIKDCSLQAETVLIWSKYRPLSKIAARFIETFQVELDR